MSKFIKAADIKALIKNENKMESACTAMLNKQQNKIICVGDSITHGSYPALLQEMLNERKESNYNY
jgi:hypothetical protein